MHLNSALMALVASLMPSIRARSIPPNTRYRTPPLGSHKSNPQDHPIPVSLPVAGPLSDAPATLDNCKRAHDVSSLLESNLHTRFLVKSLGMEELQQMLGIYITSSPYTQTCTYRQPTDDVCGFLCTPSLVSVGTLPAVEGNPCQSSPTAACDANLRRLAKQGKPSTPSIRAPNETTCGSIDGSASGFKCVGTEAGPANCGGYTVLSTSKGRYGSRLAGTDCAAISRADAVSCISDECAVQSCLARWSAGDATRCVEDQVPDTPSSVGQGSQTTRSHEARRVLAYEFQQNTTGTDRVKSHARWIPRGSDTHWLGKRDIPADDEQDRVTHIGPGHVKEDWTRIPDYRRDLA